MIANTTIARARGLAVPPAVPLITDRAKSEIVVVRYGPGATSEVKSFRRERGDQGDDEDEEQPSE